jgi:SprT protein
MEDEFAQEELPFEQSGEAESPPAKQPSDAERDSAAWQLLARDLLRQIGVACEELTARVQVRWNPRMRSTAGMAYPARALITLNPRLLTFGNAEIDRTVRHELAHLLAHHRAGRRRIAPHGHEWKAACRDLGLTDESRCHTLPLPRRQMNRPHAYRCPSCGITIRRTPPMRKKAACLACCRMHTRGRYDERFRFVRIAS